MRQRTADLCAFAFIVAAPAGLIALDLPSDQVIAATSASAVLYSAWRQGGGRPPSQGPGGGRGAGSDPGSGCDSDSGPASGGEPVRAPRREA